MGQNAVILLLVNHHNQIIWEGNHFNLAHLTDQHFQIVIFTM